MSRFETFGKLICKLVIRFQISKSWKPHWNRIDTSEWKIRLIIFWSSNSRCQCCHQIRVSLVIKKSACVLFDRQLFPDSTDFAFDFVRFAFEVEFLGRLQQPASRTRKKRSSPRAASCSSNAPWHGCFGSGTRRPWKSVDSCRSCRSVSFFFCICKKRSQHENGKMEIQNRRCM